MRRGLLQPWREHHVFELRPWISLPQRLDVSVAGRLRISGGNLGQRLVEAA